MASLRQRRGVFYLDYVDTDGIRRRTNLRTTSRQEAKRYLPKREATLAEVGEEFCRYAKTNRSPKTALRYELIIRQFWKFIHFSTPLGDITPLHIERYKQERMKVVRPVAVNTDLRHLRTLFSQATAWEYIQESPFSRKRVKFLRIPHSRAPYFTPEDFAKPLEAIHLPWLRVLAILGFHTGMRSGEMLGLRWEDVDLETRRIYLAAEKTKGRRERVVPLNTTVTEMLAALPRTSAYVLTSQQFNAPPDKHCVSHKFKQAVLKAGLDPRLHVHSLRHSFCTNLLAAGAPMQDVQLIAGHSTIVVTQGYNQMRSGTLHHTVSILDGTGSDSRPK